MMIPTDFDGEAVAERFFEKPYDLVILDIMLPKKSGMEVWQRYIRPYCRILSAYELSYDFAPYENGMRFVQLEFGKVRNKSLFYFALMGIDE